MTLILYKIGLDRHWKGLQIIERINDEVPIARLPDIGKTLLLETVAICNFPEQRLKPIQLPFFKPRSNKIFGHSIQLIH